MIAGSKLEMHSCTIDLDRPVYLHLNFWGSSYLHHLPEHFSARQLQYNYSSWICVIVCIIVSYLVMLSINNVHYMSLCQNRKAINLMLTRALV